MALFINTILWNKFSQAELKTILSKAIDVLALRNKEWRDEYWITQYENHEFINVVNWEVLTDSDLDNIINKLNSLIKSKTSNTASLQPIIGTRSISLPMSMESPTRRVIHTNDYINIEDTPLQYRHQYTYYSTPEFSTIPIYQTATRTDYGWKDDTPSNFEEVD